MHPGGKHHLGYPEPDVDYVFHLHPTWGWITDWPDGERFFFPSGENVELCEVQL